MGDRFDNPRMKLKGRPDKVFPISGRTASFYIEYGILLQSFIVQLIQPLFHSFYRIAAINIIIRIQKP